MAGRSLPRRSIRASSVSNWSASQVFDFSCICGQFGVGTGSSCGTELWVSESAGEEGVGNIIAADIGDRAPSGRGIERMSFGPMITIG